MEWHHPKTYIGYREHNWLLGFEEKENLFESSSERNWWFAIVFLFGSLNIFIFIKNCSGEKSAILWVMKFCAIVAALIFIKVFVKFRFFFTLLCGLMLVEFICQINLEKNCIACSEEEERQVIERSRYHGRESNDQDTEL